MKVKKLSNIFSKVETLSTPRSKQKMNFKEITTYNFGKLYPCFAMDCVPSDTVKINMASVIKALPMVAPNMTPDKMTVHFWFVPYRLLDENFANGVKGFNDDGETYNYDFPLWVNPHNGDDSDKLVGTLWDYFGLAINVKESSGVLVEDDTYVDGVEPTAYLKRAYNLVFNTMYRNQNTTSEVSLDSDELQFRCWRADYFTKSLPFQQKPKDLDQYFGLPINIYNGSDFDASGRFAPVTLVGRNDLTGVISSSFPKKIGPQSGTFGTGLYTNERLPNIITRGRLFKQMSENGVYACGSTEPTGASGDNYCGMNQFSDHGQGSGTYSYTELGNAYFGLDTNNLSVTGFSQSDFRLWMQIQKWAERTNRAGSSRYDEFLTVHFGVKPQDSRLQLPEFLGGIKTTIGVADAFATANSVNDVGAVVPQGTRTGIAGAGMIDKVRPYFVQEFGVIIGIASILPQAEYMQGIDRQWIKHDSLDFFRHEFCCLSDREVYDGELCVSNGTYLPATQGATPAPMNANQRSAFNTGVFGFQGVYDEMRFFRNKITGQMRTLFAHWHQARNFDATADSDKKSNVKLNQNFVEAREVALRPFVDQTGNDVFMVKHIFKVTAYRPCTPTAIPGLADHF